MVMKVKDIDALREQISKDPREAFTKHQVWLFASEHNKTVPTVEAIPKDQYEARLKADMVAMLTEIQVGIDEHINPSNHTDSYEDGWSEGAEWCIDYIQEKINSLKENKDGQE